VTREALRQLPPVNSVLQQRELDPVRTACSREVLLRAVRTALSEARLSLQNDQVVAVDPSVLAMRAREILQSARTSLRPVINATGILLHTGLGRAPLAEEAVKAVATVARGYCNLEFELEEGERGRRASSVAELLCEVTRAKAATVVNNNAGATVLALRALATGREAIVSRGQLIEIGGSFRLPEIFEVSGAKLREVGTTNKTRLADYAAVICLDTAVILRVHHSNYQIVGFTEEVSLNDLIKLAHDHGLLMIDDIGSGALAPGLPPGVANEPYVTDSIHKGADLVLFSGDKLLGGPQCGIMVGTAEAIHRIESDPLMRALRVDKMVLAALEATLQLIRNQQSGSMQIPLWRMLTLSVSNLADRAERCATLLREELKLDARAIESESFIGGGSAPVQPIRSVAVEVHPPYPFPFDSESTWAKALRKGDPPVISRVTRGVVVFDFRTVQPNEELSLLDAIRQTCHDRDQT
jgi:L-seryl-tRNA(Ser) seleniumtransferase